jgi:hypothetical protein
LHNTLIDILYTYTGNENLVLMLTGLGKVKNEKHFLDCRTTGEIID